MAVRMLANTDFTPPEIPIINGKTVNLIPVPDYYTKEIIEQEKHDDGYYKLIIYTNKMLKKVVKGNDRLARINLPSQWLGRNVLIIESPDD